jgi:DnaJ-class molecular chaperone
MTTLDNFIEFIRDDTGRDYTSTLVWVICHRCHGEGMLGGFAGAFTESDRAEWSEEDYEDYCSHRRHCEDCGGTGKVKELPEESPVAEAWAEWCAEEAADRATMRAESGYAW